MVVDHQPGIEPEGPHGLGLLSCSQMSLKPRIGSNREPALCRRRSCHSGDPLRPPLKTNDSVQPPLSHSQSLTIGIRRWSFRPPSTVVTKVGDHVAGKTRTPRRGP
ncbi:hypothetical protein V6N12_038697 [Hibiscus sabdariffa]|uniref:Uncharacterized protein n=1 Tax=Hibiscus sabdariffa TaxID=183260 RepID=A0ABR2CAK5_9ROSI